MSSRAYCGADRNCQAVPACCFFPKSFSPGGGQPIKLGAPIVLGSAPFRFEQPLMFEALERGIQRTLLGEQSAAGDLLDTQQHAIDMQGTERHSFKNHEFERAWQASGLFGAITSLRR